MLRLNQLFCVSAAHRVSTGDIAGAYAELETAIAFAQILSRGGALISPLVEIACDVHVYHRMRLIALQNNVPPEVAGRAINCLLESDKSAEPLAETFRQEYRAVPTMVKMFFDPHGQTLFGFDEKKANSERQARWSAHLCGELLGSSQERVMADLADVYRCLVNLADTPYDVKHLQRFEVRNGAQPHLQSVQELGEAGHHDAFQDLDITESALAKKLNVFGTERLFGQRKGIAQRRPSLFVPARGAVMIGFFAKRPDVQLNGFGIVGT